MEKVIKLESTCSTTSSRVPNLEIWTQPHGTSKVRVGKFLFLYYLYWYCWCLVQCWWSRRRRLVYRHISSYLYSAHTAAAIIICLRLSQLFIQKKQSPPLLHPTLSFSPLNTSTSSNMQLKCSPLIVSPSALM